MFQFTTTNIINSSLDSNGTTAKYSGDASAFTVTRVGKFLVSNVVGSVFKKAYTAGVLEIAQVTIPTITAGLVARLDVDVRLSQQTHSEYANSYLYFKKPVTVEVIATGTATTDATALAAQINGLKDRFGHSYITASTSGADLILTAKNVHQRFFSIKILSEQAAPYTNTIIEPLFDDVSSTTFSVTTPGLVGFGNDEWMYARIRMQSLDNHRPFGIARDELPVIGGNYTQYTLRYQVAKDHVDGVSLANDTSITTHVFYVKSDLVAGFEAALVAASLPIDTIGSAVSAIVIGGNTLTMSAGAGTAQLTATTTPVGVTGGVWTLTDDNTVAGSLDATKLSLTTGGLMTVLASSGLAAADTIGVSVTVDGFTQTGDVTIAGT